MNWGGIAASALGGAVIGSANAASQQILQDQKAEIERMRDERLAQLAQQTHKANAQASADIDLSMIGPKTAATAKATNDAAEQYAPLENARAVAKQAALAPGEIDTKTKLDEAAAKMKAKYGDHKEGETYLDPDTNKMVTVPKTATPETESTTALHNALAAKYLNEAKKDVEDMKKSTAGKLDIKVDKESGEITAIDQTTKSIAIGTRIPPVEGQPAKEGFSILGHKFGKDTPAVEAVGAKYKWTDTAGNPIADPTAVTAENPSASSSKGGKKSARSGTIETGLVATDPGAPKVGPTIKGAEVGPTGTRLVGHSKETGNPIFEYPDGRQVEGS